MASNGSQATLGAAVAVFVGLALAGVAMCIAVQWVEVAWQQGVLQSIGAALFGAGLAFFLIEAFAWDRRIKGSGEPHDRVRP